MRRIKTPERVKRGCLYCTDAVLVPHFGSHLRHCPYEECPYREMDNYASYIKYLKATGGDTLVELLRMAGIK